MVITKGDLEKAGRREPLDPQDAPALLDAYLKRRAERLAKEEAERRLKRERARSGAVGDFDERLTELERRPD